MWEFIKGVRKEATKVVFPTWDEVKKNTLIVVAVCAASALVLWGVSELIIEGLKVTL